MTTADIPLWAALPASLLLIVGGMLALIGSCGLLRLPHFYARMHAPTLGNTLGLGCVLLASILAASGQEQRPVLHQILIAVLVTMTSPVTALLLMQAAMYRDCESTRSIKEP